MIKIMYIIAASIMFIFACVVGTVGLDIIVGIIFSINPSPMWKAIPSLLSLIVAFITWIGSLWISAHFYSEAKES